MSIIVYLSGGFYILELDKLEIDMFVNLAWGCSLRMKFEKPWCLLSESLENAVFGSVDLGVPFIWTSSRVNLISRCSSWIPFSKQIQENIADTFKRQSAAIARRRSTAAAILRKAHGKFRIVQSRQRRGHGRGRGRSGGRGFRSVVVS